jgi:hypothetical protein
LKSNNADIVFFIFQKKEIEVSEIINNWDDIVVFLKWNKLIPQFYNAIKETGLFEKLTNPIQLEIKQYHQQCIYKTLQIEAVLKFLLTEFNKNKIQPILLKGVHLARTLYQQPYYRQMIDIDLLIETGQLPKTLDMLKNLGCTTAYPLESEHTMGQWHQFPPFLYKGVSIEIHKSLFAEYEKDVLPTTIVFQQALQHTVFELNCLVLSPTHNFYYLCRHICKHIKSQFNRLNWLQDIALFYEYYQNEIDFREFMHLLEQTGNKHNVLDVLSLSASIFNCTFGNRIVGNENLAINYINKCYEPINREAAINTFKIFGSIKSPVAKIKYLAGKAFPSQSYIKYKFNTQGLRGYFALYCYYLKKLFRC